MRIHYLDYLRGIASVLVMLFHLTSWSQEALDANNLLMRLAIYGPTIFFMLSGVTLFHVYSKRLHSNDSLIQYAKKRFFRIYPLIWLVILVTVILNKTKLTTQDIFLNVTLTHGFFFSDKFLATGQWTLGSEIIFYCIFPFIVQLQKHSNKWFMFVYFLSFLIFCIFTFNLLTADLSLEIQWNLYVNPFNHLFSFLSGIFIASNNLLRQQRKQTANVLGFSGLILFIFIPTSRDSIDILTGLPRLSFTISCFFICNLFYVQTRELSLRAHKVFNFLGETSYSIYLLHPIIALFVSKLLVRTQILKKIGLGYEFGYIIGTVVLTLTISHFSYNYFEKKMLRFVGNIKH